MTKGVVLFAHNTDKVNYYAMATASAKRINQYLDLPVTVITDADSIIDTDYVFDNTIIIEPDRNNYLKRNVWINRGRYMVGELSPYDETLVLDSDYVVNSQELLKTMELPSDFVCYHRSTYMFDRVDDEPIGKYGLYTMWATVIRFRKTRRVANIFGMMKMVQENYEHYAKIYYYMPYVYRNDYALTIALRTVNGQIEFKQDFIPGRLRHIGKNIDVQQLGDTEFKLTNIHENRRVVINDLDFHMLDKENFRRIFCA